jgi:hypothetical protein
MINKEQLWHYANTTMYDLIKTDEQLVSFLKEIKKFNEEEKVLLKQYWELMTYGETDDIPEENTVDLKEEEEDITDQCGLTYYDKEP